MPNGGSDCCGTCWFNAKNKGQAGFAHAFGTESAFCAIRDLPIDDPFYTYCGNHPHRRPQQDPIPLGPVFVGDSSGDRQIWRPSPDTEEIRLHLLALLREMTESPVSEYPMGIASDEIVVWQLGEFRESRAFEDLRRVARFDPSTKGKGPFGRVREGLVVLALEALAKLEGRPLLTSHMRCMEMVDNQLVDNQFETVVNPKDLIPWKDRPIGRLLLGCLSLAILAWAIYYLLQQ